MAREVTTNPVRSKMDTLLSFNYFDYDSWEQKLSCVYVPRGMKAIATQIDPPKNRRVARRGLRPVRFTMRITKTFPGMSMNPDTKNTKYGFPGSTPVLNANP